MPAAADILLLVRFLQDLSDFGVPVHVSDEAIDVDRCELLGKRHMRFGRYVLVSEKEHAVFAERIPQFTYHVVGQAVRKVYTIHEGAHAAARRLDHLGHIHLHAACPSARSPHLTVETKCRRRGSPGQCGG